MLLMFPSFHSLQNPILRTCFNICIFLHDFRIRSVMFCTKLGSWSKLLLNLKNKVIQVCQDQFKQNWMSTINKTSKCISYRIFKSNFGLETYLIDVPLNLRYYVVKFRCRSNKLPVETGSFTDIAYNERFCNKCNKQEVGDEFHVLFHCKFYNKERALLLPQKYQTVNSVLFLSDLFDLKGNSMICIAKLIKIILKSLD